MKTVTADFESAQLSVDHREKKAVYYKRRYWNQATNAYAWEASWTLLPLAEVISLSPVSWKLDTEQLNEFKVSNVSLIVKNHDNKWLPTNRFGFFAKDAASPLLQYEPYWTKFQIRAGFTLYDDTDELVNVFTGVATEFQYDSSSGNCQITIQGLEATLVNTQAEAIATTVTQENKGDGDGAETEYTTTNPGVGGVILVSVDGITQVEGADYTVSQLNEESLGAKVTFVDPPDVGETVRISYFYWPQDQAFHDLVGLLLDAAGVASGDQLVDPVTFENSVISTQSFTSQADWDTGTDTLLETVLSPGNLRVDFASVLTARVWTTSVSGWTDTVASNWESDGTSLIPGDSNSFLYRADTALVGAWQLTLRAENTSNFAAFAFAVSNPLIGTSGYDISISGGTTLILRAPGGTTIASVAITVAVNTDYVFKIVRYPNGRILVYVDGVLKIDVTNTASVTGGYVQLFGRSPGGVGGAAEARVKDISTPTATIAASWESAVIDMGSIPSAWGSFDYEDDADGATLTYQTKTSTDGISFDAYVTVSGQGVPQSTLKRYIRIKVLFDMQADQQFDPLVQSLDLRWVTSGVNIILPEFAGISVYEAIQRLGEFTQYEFGFTPDEDFFFRPKTVSSSVLSLDQTNLLSRVGAMTLGYEDVYGTVRVTYGTATREVTDDGAFPDSPVARVSGRRYEFSADDGIQIAATADIATGVALSLYKRLSRPRKRMLVNTKFLPQVDLSDVITLRLVDNTPEPLWYVGDPEIYFGHPTAYFWGDPGQLLTSVQVKVIGARYDLSNWNCEFEIEEVL